MKDHRPLPEELIGYLFSLETYGIKLGLKKIHILNAAMDYPDRSFSSVIVAGTNGKGSVAAMLERGLRAAGYRTGLFTSPHLVDLSERIAINGRPVNMTILAQTIGVLRNKIDALSRTGQLDSPPTFFEMLTAMALSIFRLERVQVAILEVGMGGRFDATNVVSPIAVAIPSIDIDHQQFLGNTIEEIAFEKAGVIGSHSVVVTAETKPDARNVLQRVSQQCNAKLIDVDSGTLLRVKVRAGLTDVETLETPRRHYEPLTLSLRGRHQIRNVLVTVRLLEEIQIAGISIPTLAIRQAITDVHWRGRLELIERKPTERILLDTAHNVAAMGALSDYILKFSPAGLPFIFGALRDKDVIGMVKALGTAANHLICAPIENRRGWSSTELASLIRTVRTDLTIQAASDTMAALSEGWKRSPLVCATGSVYLIGSLIQALESDTKV